MPYHSQRYYQTHTHLIKSPDDKILFPDHWYDKDLPFLVSGFGKEIPVNRVVAMFSPKDCLEMGSPCSEIFWINENKVNDFDKPDSESREEVQQFIEEKDITRIDKEWWDFQGIYESASYYVENRLKEEMGWNETISELRSKNHHIWYLMWNDPLKLEYIEPGGNDEIWGEIGEVDYNNFML